MGDFLQNNYDILEDLRDICVKDAIENPKVSIIVPVYNVEEYLRKSLDSVVNQTLKDIEIICVDDCSTDGSLNILKEYAKKDNRIRIIEQKENQGQGVARNIAIDIAQGEYIMFLDPDDWLELNACEEAYNQINKNKNDMVFFNLYIWKEHNGKCGKRELDINRLKPFEEVKNNPYINLRELQTNWFIGGWTWVQIYSKDFLNKNNIIFSTHRYGEDLIFITKAMIESKDISILDVPLYNYRKRKSSSKVYTDCYKDVIETKKNTYKIIEVSGCNKDLLNNFLLYEIASNNMHFKKYTKANRKIRKDFYARLKKRFEEISKSVPEEILKQSHFYDDFVLILSCKSYEEYKIKRFLRKVLG